MPRTFAHFNVTFTRTVEQEQTVDVAVDPELTPDIKQTVAEQLASARIKESGWTVRDRSTPQLVGSEPLGSADRPIQKRSAPKQAAE